MTDEFRSPYDLASLQKDFTKRLSNPSCEESDIEDYIQGGLFEPSERLQIHQNNVHLSLVDTIVSSFPVTSSMTGDDFIRAVAREFVKTELPSAPMLSAYAPRFADFWLGFDKAQDYPFIADMLRAEAAIDYVQEMPESIPISPVEWQKLSQSKILLENNSLKITKSKIAFCSRWPIIDMWLAATGQLDFDGIEMADNPQNILVINVEGDVFLHSLSQSEYDFLSYKGEENGVEQRCEIYLKNAEEFGKDSLGSVMASLFEKGIFIY
ncbi:DNA-binding domain-containing protein [Temperatibacter marinus]|uniref:DNA-binding domain-containing protein n=1 Tax=Temperatibacter marinus TaxID=1456591 RepID=A0AA52EF57_9PROT|nr:DNA-binding domain-containing protein [Temperatibacter marinus]WND01690.1 DNA-binding domain-containing protein [Temperatibacter marinus]